MLDFNDKFVEMIGTSRENLIGFNMPERQQDERMRQAVLDALDGNISHYEGNYRSVTGGKVTPMRAVYGRVVSDDGRLLGGVGIFEDITERKLAQEALQQSEQMLKGILATSPVGIGLTKDRKMKWVNRSWEEMFGFENQDVLDQDASIVYPSQAEYERVGKELYPNLSLGHVTQTDARFIRQDGSFFDGYIRMKAVDPSDPAKGTIAAISDISSRRQAEEALRESEGQKQAILDGITTNIAFVNEDLEIQWVNKTAADSVANYPPR